MRKNKLLLLLVLLAAVATGAWAQTQEPATYKITVAEGTEDVENWDVPKEAAEGSPVTATYNGKKKVKSVKAVKKAPAATDLATITADYEAKDGETLTGTLASNVKISIAAGATVTLKDVNITNLGNNCDWAGINCPGDATLVLEGTNTVCAGRGGDGYNNYPGIYIAPDKTLTIQGDGTLTAYSNDSQPYGAGIGGGYGIACGNIVINSGTITATGGQGAAGIGSGQGAGCGNITINGGTVTATGGTYGAGIGSGGDGNGNKGSCGNITISGGTVTATGGNYAAGIGGGENNGACGTITITKGVTSVKATNGEGAEGIGKGKGGQDITVNIENGANVTAGPTLSLTSPAVGQVIGSDGKNYAYGSLPTGVTAVAKICYVSGSNGLALALTDEEGKMNWSTAQTTCAAHTPAFTGGTWKLATKDEWDNMINAAGSYTNLRDGFSSVGGTNMLEDLYWSSTERDSDVSKARAYYFNFIGNWSFVNKEAIAGYVRACLAF